MFFAYELQRIMVNAFILQFNDLATIYKFITITVYIIMFLVELSRIYLGYVGNLREKVGVL